MCGIAGVVALAGQTVDADLLVAMRDTLAHRGPDAVGLLIDRNLGLGHRRLSIIDTSAAADQPLANEDGEVQVIFNGEIYNFQALCEALAARGHRFRSHSDTEALVHGWEEHGTRLVDRLRGMFAFALYDRRQGLLFLARDRFGQKPLHYAVTDAGFVFASEIKALLAHPAVPREIDPVGLAEFMIWGHTAGERTVYAAIRRLLPGHTLTLDLERPGAPRIEAYWELEPRPEEGLELDAWLDELDATIAEAVRLRLISDVPLGAFLSGGIDSSLVVAAMARQAPGLVRTFSMGYREARWDESGHARAVADHLGTDHCSELVTPEVVTVLPRLVEAYDEPFGDPSAIPTWYLSRMTRRHVTVALSGDGGDELFFGYRRYAESAALARLGGALTEPGRALARGVARLLPTGSWVGRALDRLSHREAALYLHALGFSPVYLDLLAPAVREALGAVAAQRAAEHFDRYPGLPFLDRCRFADLGAYLPDDILVKVDRAAMAHSLEVRCPLLDHEVAAVAARLPAAAQMRGRDLKLQLRRLAYRSVPRELLDRPKQGFAVPLSRWFRHELEPLITRAVEDGASPVWEFFDRSEARRRLRHHLAGRMDAAPALWRLLFAHAWAEA